MILLLIPIIQRTYISKISRDLPSQASLARYMGDSHADCSVKMTFVSLVILKGQGGSCFGGDPGDNYYRIVIYQYAGNLDLDMCSVIFACFSVFHQNTESLFQGSVVLKKGKRCFAREHLDLDVTRTFSPASQSPNSIDCIAVRMHYAIEIAKVVH